MVNSWVNGEAHNSHLHVVNEDVWKLFHDFQVFVLLAVVPVNGSAVETQVECRMLIGPVKNIRLGSIGLAPSRKILPVLLIVQIT